MSNGFLVASAADLDAAHEIAEGFGLDVLASNAIPDTNAAVEALIAAPNVGVLISTTAANDAFYVSFLQLVAQRVLRAQLIVAEEDARERFAFLPGMWPVMTLADAQGRARAIARQQAPEPPQEEPPHAHPLPPTEPPAPEHEQPQAHVEPTPPPEPPISEPDAPSLQDEDVEARDDAASTEHAREDTAPAETFGAADERPALPPAVEPPTLSQDPYIPPPAPAPEAPSIEPAPGGPPQSSDPPRKRAENDGVVVGGMARSSAAPSTAPADATAFAPKKLRRDTPELVRIVVHQPKDLNDVIKAARKIDPRSEPAPSGMTIGDVPLGSAIGVSLEVRGASCDGSLQRRTWRGEPIDFSFSVEADAGVKQVVVLARVFIDDAQIGVLAFTRNVTGPSKKPASDGDRVRLKRHKRVFLSYSSHDRETVSQIATAYDAAGIEYFWDRSSLKSGEEWSPRLRKEIEKADLFHLCWSKSAAASEWVEKEAEFALTRRKRNSGKPDITVQMLDGPPWAAHPPLLDSINFDDFVRAAIVGYARGDGSN